MAAKAEVAAASSASAPVALSGFGASLRVKSTEYKVVDDGKALAADAAEADESEDADDAVVGIAGSRASSSSGVDGGGGGGGSGGGDGVPDDEAPSWFLRKLSTEPIAGGERLRASICSGWVFRRQSPPSAHLARSRRSVT